MRREVIWIWSVAGLVAAVATAAGPAGLAVRKTESGTVVGYKDTPRLPWTDDAYCVHDPDRPVPKPVTTAPLGESAQASSAPSAPSDAIVLFDGTDLEHWKPGSWVVKDGAMVTGAESLVSNDAFGSCQLHLEFATPREPAENFMNRGNSGVLIMGLYEVQIFDSWPGHQQQIYPDGQAASIYGQTPPLVNACRAPGEWQSYDIVFTAPVFSDGKLVTPPRITMFHNGVLVHLDQEVFGPMAHRTIMPTTPHPPQLPLTLQGHGSPIRFRNIWARPL